VGGGTSYPPPPQKKKISLNDWFIHRVQCATLWCYGKVECNRYVVLHQRWIWLHLRWGNFFSILLIKMCFKLFFLLITYQHFIFPERMMKLMGWKVITKCLKNQVLKAADSISPLFLLAVRWPWLWNSRWIVEWRWSGRSNKQHT
jgi:hypothetical protein